MTRSHVYLAQSGVVTDLFGLALTRIARRRCSALSTLNLNLGL